MKQARPSLGFCFLCWLKTTHIVLICGDEFPIKLTNSDKGKDLLEIKQHGLVIRLNSSSSLWLKNEWRWHAPLFFRTSPATHAWSFPCPGSATSQTAPLSRCNTLTYVKNNLTEKWIGLGFFPPGYWVGSAQGSEQPLTSARAGVSVGAWQQHSWE